MNKKMYVWLVVALLAVPAGSMAPEVVEIVDSVYTDIGEIVADSIRLGAIDEWQQNLPQYDLKEYEWVEIC